MSTCTPLHLGLLYLQFTGLKRRTGKFVAYRTGGSKPRSD